MKIQTEDFRSVSAEDFEMHFCRVLDGQRDGVAENAQATADNVARALGRLVEQLASKGLLSPEEVLRISGDITARNPKFV